MCGGNMKKELLERRLSSLKKDLDNAVKYNRPDEIDKLTRYIDNTAKILKKVVNS